jgi:hypothetical protein
VPVISNLFELAGMAAIVAGVWWLAGDGVALLVGGACALLVGIALEGAKLTGHGGP